MSVVPLLLLWAFTRGQGAAPVWPSPAAPPPRKPTAKPPGRAHVPPVDLPAPPAPPGPAPFQAAMPADQTPAPPPSPELDQGRERQAASVLSVQRALNARGAKLKPDGLFGPKTVNAYRGAAYGLSPPRDPFIVRLGPKTVAVNRDTYAALAMSPVARGVTGDFVPYIP